MKTQLLKSIFQSVKCLVLISTILLSSYSYASEPKEIDWEDLIPWTAMFNPSEVKFNKKLDDKEVKIPGYILPLDIIGRDINTFLLVPYIGACIHVPAPLLIRLFMLKLKNHGKDLLGGNLCTLQVRLKSKTITLRNLQLLDMNL